MLHYATIEPNTLELLKKLQTMAELKDTRLVGGTALALQMGHRKSVDLDLFGHINCTPDELESALRKVASVILLKKSTNINIYVVDGVKVDIVNYKYDWLEPSLCEDGIVMAQFPDIAAMKVNAIIGRGTRKDFVDIAYLLKKFTLSNVLHFYFKKYPEASMFLAAKSLSYFVDAENLPMPEMLVDDSWENMKSYIAKQYEEYELEISERDNH